ncbi:hypothetical protein AYI68_g815 [Smittium mucronatum]|uniref:Uncharacterized protein n=1 Tax=Smittium mucronatum TaxID=133383 RepID=A0A1R0H772_9FUNG|nr:hypothetical protein AYI68_g815 [Smittium mucronatum]
MGFILPVVVAIIPDPLIFNRFLREFSMPLELSFSENDESLLTAGELAINIKIPEVLTNLNKTSFFPPPASFEIYSSSCKSNVSIFKKSTVRSTNLEYSSGTDTSESENKFGFFEISISLYKSNEKFIKKDEIPNFVFLFGIEHVYN